MPYQRNSILDQIVFLPPSSFLSLPLLQIKPSSPQLLHDTLLLIHTLGIFSSLLISWKHFPHFHYCSLYFSSCLLSVCKSKLKSNVAMLWFYYITIIKILGSVPNINASIPHQISNIPLKTAVWSWDEACGATIPVILQVKLSVPCFSTCHCPNTTKVGSFTASMTASCTFVVWHFHSCHSTGEDDRQFWRAWKLFNTELHRLC